jgi:hypothetical protein
MSTNISEGAVLRKPVRMTGEWSQEYKFTLGHTVKDIIASCAIMSQIDIVQKNFKNALLDFIIAYIELKKGLPSYNILQKHLPKIRNNVLGIEDIASASLRDITRKLSAQIYNIAMEYQPVIYRHQHVRMITDVQRHCFFERRYGELYYPKSIYYALSANSIDWNTRRVRLPKTGRREHKGPKVHSITFPVSPDLEEKHKVGAMILVYKGRSKLGTHWIVKWKKKLI